MNSYISNASWSDEVDPNIKLNIVYISARKYKSELSKSDEQTMNTIVRYVSKFYKISVDELLNIKTTASKGSEPKQVCIYLAIKEYNIHPKIAGSFFGLDRVTAIHANKVIENHVETECKFADKILRLKSRIGFGLGINHQNAKVNESLVLEIRKLSDEGYSTRQIAKNYNIGKTAVWQIIKRITWNHVK
jgi:hypothetical protein